MSAFASAMDGLTNKTSRDYTPLVAQIKSILCDVSDDAACDALIKSEDDVQGAIELLLRPDDGFTVKKSKGAKKELSSSENSTQQSAAANPPSQPRQSNQKADKSVTSHKSSAANSSAQTVPKKVVNTAPPPAEESWIPVELRKKDLAPVQKPEPIVLTQEEFIAMVRQERAPTKLEKDLMKLNKKLGEIEKIEQKLAAGEKVDQLQLPKLQKKDELVGEKLKIEGTVETEVKEEAKAMKVKHIAEEKIRCEEEYKRLLEERKISEKERLQKIEELRQQLEEERKRKIEEEKQRKLEEERQREQEEERQRQEALKLEEERIRRKQEDDRRRIEEEAQREMMRRKMEESNVQSPQQNQMPPQMSHNNSNGFSQQQQQQQHWSYGAGKNGGYKGYNNHKGYNNYNKDYRYEDVRQRNDESPKPEDGEDWGMSLSANSSVLAQQREQRLQEPNEESGNGGGKSMRPPMENNYHKGGKFSDNWRDQGNMMKGGNGYFRNKFDKDGAKKGGKRSYFNNGPGNKGFNDKGFENKGFRKDFGRKGGKDFGKDKDYNFPDRMMGESLEKNFHDPVDGNINNME